MDATFQSLPAPLQQEIKQIPHDDLVEVMRRVVAAYRQSKDDDIDALIAEADAELAAEGKSTKPLQQRRAEFIQTCSDIATKYFS